MLPGFPSFLLGAPLEEELIVRSGGVMTIAPVDSRRAVLQDPYDP